MTNIELSARGLTVHLSGIDRMLALRSRMDIPYENLVRVGVKKSQTGPSRGLGAVLTRIPAAIAPGTFHQQSGRGALEHHDPAKTLVLDLLDARYSRLVVEVDNPRATASAIIRAVQNN